MAKKNPLKYLKFILAAVLSVFVCAVTVFLIINNVDYIEVEGEIKPVEYQIISPKISGIIKKCFYKDGDSVRKGSVVMEMDDREYELDLEALSDKKALQSMKIDSLKGKLNLYTRERSLFTGKMYKDLSDLKIKRDNDIISQSEYEDEVYKLKEEKLSQDDRVMSVENDFTQLSKEMDSISTEIDSMKDKIDKCSIYSLLDGIIVDEDSRIKEGVYYNSGDVIQKIYANNDAYAEVYIPERKIIKVELNQKVKLFVDAVPYTKYKTFDGRLVSLKETKDKDTSSGYTGKVLIEDPFFKMKNINDIKTKKLLFGLKLRARLYTGKRSLLDYIIRKGD